MLKLKDNIDLKERLAPLDLEGGRIMIGYYVTDTEGKAILSDTIFLNSEDADRMSEYYGTKGVRATVKTIKVQGTKLAVWKVVDGNAYNRDPEGMDNYIKQSMIHEFAKKLDIDYGLVHELDTYIGSQVGYHFRGSIELPKEYIKDTEEGEEGLI